MYLNKFQGPVTVQVNQNSKRAELSLFDCELHCCASDLSKTPYIAMHCRVVECCHTVLEGGRTKKKLTGAGIGAKFLRIMSRVTTKNLKIGL